MKRIVSMVERLASAGFVSVWTGVIRYYHIPNIVVHFIFWSCWSSRTATNEDTANLAWSPTKCTYSNDSTNNSLARMVLVIVHPICSGLFGHNNIACLADCNQSTRIVWKTWIKPLENIMHLEWTATMQLVFVGVEAVFDDDLRYFDISIFTVCFIFWTCLVAKVMVSTLLSLFWTIKRQLVMVRKSNGLLLYFMCGFDYVNSDIGRPVPSWVDWQTTQFDIIFHV